MIRNVAVVLCGEVSPFELGVVCEVFGIDRTADGLPGFDFAVCAAEPPPLATTAGGPPSPSFRLSGMPWRGGLR